MIGYAYTLGFEARRQGLVLEMNPYRPDSENAIAWAEGFRSAS